MPTILGSFLITLSLQPYPHLTPVNSLQELKQPFLGCAQKADLDRVVKMMDESSGVEKAKRALRYGRAHCVQLQKGIVSVVRRLGDDTCVVRRPYQSCLWVPTELIGSSFLDDGAF
jgi:hypothetical protein